jgi:PAS domain S-box-containing protein
MKGYEEELISIKRLLRDNPKGLTVSDIAAAMGISRNAAGKYMEILAISGQVEMQTFGPAKVYFLSRRIPLSAMVDITSDMILVFDKDLCIVQVNEGMLALLGKAREEVVGRNLPSLQLPVSSDLEPEEAIRAAFEDRSSTGQLCFSDEEGERYFNAKIMPSTFEDGTLGVTMVLEDVTEEKQMEMSLQSSQENLSNFFNSIDDFLFVADLDRRIIHVNDTVIKRLGYWRSELIGHPIYMIHPPEEQERARREVQAIIDGKANISTVPLLTHSGEIIPVETKVVRGIWDGKPVNFGVAKDVSELRFSEEMLAHAFELNPLAMVISTVVGGKILRVNEAFEQITGYTKEEAVGATMSALDLYADKSQRDEILARLCESGKLTNIRFVLCRKDGSKVEGLLSAVRIDYARNPCVLSVLANVADRDTTG